MPGAVKCNVEECVYNESLHCSADSILIKSIGNDVVGTTRGTWELRKRQTNVRHDLLFAWILR